MAYECARTARRSGRSRLFGLLALAALLAAGVAAAPAAADEPPKGAVEGRGARLAPTSDAAAAQQAREAIPWRRLTPTDRQRVQRVVENASLYRRLPTRVAACQPEVFTFLARRPEVVTGVWNLMGISKLTVERESDAVFHARDNVGGEGRVRVLCSDRGADARGLSLALIDGLYHQKPMPRPIKASCVLLLRSGSTTESNGQPYVTARLDAFVRFERVAADLVARGLHPLLVKTADHNFVETMNFVSTFSRTAETNPAGMRRLAGKLKGVGPAARAEMVAVCDRASQAASLRTAARAAERARLAMLRDPGEAPSASERQGGGGGAQGDPPTTASSSTRSFTQ